jgi:hypothetical protein
MDYSAHGATVLALEPIAEVPAFTTEWVTRIFGSTFRRQPGGPGEMFYTGPFYNDRIARTVRLARRALVTYFLPHTFTSGSGPARGICRICQFPGADAACVTDEQRAEWSR